jgi:hypothetical protein
VPVVRFSRDRRGYEHVYLVQPGDRGHGGRSRILYWFRTPPGVKVGRSPFDADTRRDIEARNPGVSFDWPNIVAAQMPPPVPVEGWRERRRVERAIKRARASEPPQPSDVRPVSDLTPSDVVPMSDASQTEVGQLSDEDQTEVGQLPDMSPTQVGPVSDPPSGRARRRRRRGGRRHQKPSGGPVPAEAVENEALDRPGEGPETSNEE